MDNDNAKGGTGTNDTTWASQSVTLAPNDADTHDPTTTDADKTTYTYRSTTEDVLAAGSLRWFRVIAITLENDGRGSTGGDELADGYGTRTEDFASGRGHKRR